MRNTAAGLGSGIFYGWYVVAAAFIVTFLGFGSAYTFSAFFDPLQREFSASRGSVSLVFSLAGSLYFGTGMISGPLADRFGARALSITGMILLGAGLVLAGLARSLTEVYLAYTLGVGLGVGFSYVPVLGAVQRWFRRQRGFASGLAVSGIGVGTLVMPPLATWLISLLDWRTSYVLFGCFVATIGVGISLLLVDDPRHRGLAPDGAPMTSGTDQNLQQGNSIRQAIRSPRFTTLYAACLLCSFGAFIPFVHLVPYALDQGISHFYAVGALGMIGIGSTAGRFLLGALADRLGRENSLLLMFIGMALAMSIWALSTNMWQLSVFALVYGLFYGGWVALLPAVVMDRFGGRNVSGIIGVLYTSVALGTLIGPTAAGLSFDLTQSYTLPILASIVANLGSAFLITRTYGTSIVRRRR
ncbi:MFS transporter [Pseudorhizobium endolithicum]|nr:MFS transporter [Pseudorhizobium endolithicum]